VPRRVRRSTAEAARKEADSSGTLPSPCPARRSGAKLFETPTRASRSRCTAPARSGSSAEDAELPATSDRGRGPPSDAGHTVLKEKKLLMRYTPAGWRCGSRAGLGTGGYHDGLRSDGQRNRYNTKVVSPRRSEAPEDMLIPSGAGRWSRRLPATGGASQHVLAASCTARVGTTSRALAQTQVDAGSRRRSIRAGVVASGGRAAGGRRTGATTRSPRSKQKGNPVEIVYRRKACRSWVSPSAIT